MGNEAANNKVQFPNCSTWFWPGFIMISGEMIEVDSLKETITICEPTPPAGNAPKPTPAESTEGEKSEVIHGPKPDQKLNMEVLKGKEAAQTPTNLPPIARTPPEVKQAKPAE